MHNTNTCGLGTGCRRLCCISNIQFLRCETNYINKKSNVRTKRSWHGHFKRIKLHTEHELVLVLFQWFLYNHTSYIRIIWNWIWLAMCILGNAGGRQRFLINSEYCSYKKIPIWLICSPFQLFSWRSHLCIRTKHTAGGSCCFRLLIQKHTCCSKGNSTQVYFDVKEYQPPFLF